jgi:signal peptidase II
VRILFVSFLVVLIDQISKLIVKGIAIPFLKIYLPGMYVGQKISVVDGLFNITFVENPGIAFGLNPGDNYKLLISLFTVAVSMLLIYYLYRHRNNTFSFKLSLAVIIGGAIGNLIDRLFYGVIYGYAGVFHGRVVDFFNLRFFNLVVFDRILGGYVFNVADLAVTIGVILFLSSLDRKNAEIMEDNIAVEKCLVENKD